MSRERLGDLPASLLVGGDPPLLVEFKESDFLGRLGEILPGDRFGSSTRSRGR
ncbi:hypothetical protein [Natrialba taiwanensis]|uniref:hypothetical protein n=1 Tax=Natrialba taiwanensis TaxID=160846 RepID=UPI000A80F495|nr:hypothetical protein [Natrialba taiwanensis]